MTVSGDSVLLAMSGGVDSSVAAVLLRRAGYRVTGVFMCLGGAIEGERDSRGCCSPQDAADARRVADRLGIDLFVLNLAKPFTRVVDYFVEEYRRGRTPNPCLRCNADIKFGALFNRADAIGARYIATGHYARVIEVGGRPALARAQARAKDQSYALAMVAPKYLPRMLLPIGESSAKGEVRAIARELGLNVHDKPDSQEICFVPNDDYTDLLRRRAPEALRPGNIVDSSGRVLGRHEGYARFTIGQRKGHRIAAAEAMYVTRIDAATATVTIGPRAEVLSTRLVASGANWHADVPEEFDATVQIRYNHAGEPARVRKTDPARFEVEFTQPVLAITPGQAAVVYQQDRLLGGGWIE